MVFKVDKNADKPELKLFSFRLPIKLMEALNQVSEKEKVSTTELVRQMLKHCLDTYEKQRK